MQRIGDVQIDIPVNAAVRRVPVRIVPGNLVGLELVHILGDGRVHFCRKCRQALAGSRREIQIVAGGFRRGSFSGIGRRVFHEPVVAHHSEDVRHIETQPRCQVKTEWDETRLAHAEKVAVEINLGHLPRCLKFDEDLFALESFRQGKCLPIPRAPAPLVLFAAMPR